jgi:hypothetical protein
MDTLTHYGRRWKNGDINHVYQRVPGTVLSTVSGRVMLFQAITRNVGCHAPEPQGVSTPNQMRSPMSMQCNAVSLHDCLGLSRFVWKQCPPFHPLVNHHFPIIVPMQTATHWFQLGGECRFFRTYHSQKCQWNNAVARARASLQQRCAILSLDGAGSNCPATWGLEDCFPFKLAFLGVIVSLEDGNPWRCFFPYNII